MEMYQLRYVLSVAKYQNFSRAAAEVCVTPSSLSQQIKKLEDELGVVLFGRTTRSVHLTPAGLEFVENAKKIMLDMVETNNSMQKYVVGESGQITIGNTPALGAYGITSLIATFQRTYPKISLEFHEAECFDLYPLIYNGKIEVAFLTAFDKHKPGKFPLDAYPLVNDEIVLITSTSHPFAAKQVIDLREAAQETFICFSKSSGLFVDTIEACGAAGFKPKFGYDTQYTDTCLGLVAEGLGIAMISSRTVMAAQRKNIAIVRFTPTARRTLSVVFPKKRKLSPVLSNFKNFFIHWLQEREYA
ncbi:LysR family transcriptional regulator [Sporomusa acidovorans]|uniref:HTH-type transcriptional regulator GltC n=1 Tax=Sporomusa acidovorans (strain ATCC 49682 / DSM 3132 / Mol) TaxID=1123286 RepID=A0ABZ3J0N5_SPOA4|nr:LysR family transcriptional regulator [Sporomusa acidovorans]OZC21375.1 HTH-type transcriptional regulator GltC [Sporomusa acidovorans DSM 3132]SDE55975.1 regulatory helix-turn-helix protein, lysR family [Sporomusa acidovorans]